MASSFSLRRKVSQNTSHRARFLPRLEALEPRLALATAVWDGGGADANWTTAANWVGNALPSAGDELLFPGSAQQLASVNDFAANTSFAGITFAGGGYSITGAAIQLAGPITTWNPTGGNTFDLPLSLVGGRSINNTYAGSSLSLAGTIVANGTLTVSGSGNTNLSGVISGSGGIIKNGPGTLAVTGDNTYAGLTSINAGMLQTSGFGKPLGLTTAGTVVANGATLQTTNINDNMAEPLTLNGHGISAEDLGSTHGALEIGPPAFTTWTGPITLGSDASIGVPHTGNFTMNTSPITLNGHKLTINAAGSAVINTPIVDGSGVGSIDINTTLARGTEYGTVQLTAANTYTGPTLIKSGVLSLAGNGTLASTDIQVDGVPGVAGSNGFPLAGGVLQLDNATTLNANRIPDDATVTFSGGAFRYLGNNAAVSSTESIGEFHLDSGQSFIASVVGNVVGASSTVTVGSLVRETTATVDFSGTGLGTASNRLLFTQAPVNVGANGGILPYATFTTSTQDFATYSASLGVTAFTGYATNLATATSNDIVLVTASQSISSNKNFVAMVLRGAPVITLGAGVTLNLQRSLLTTGTSADFAVGGTLTFGAEGIVHRYAGTTIKSAIGGATALTLSGSAALTLEPPVSGNTYTGGTTLNSGALTINNNNTPLGDPTAPLNLRGGALGISVFVGPITFPQPLTFNQSDANFSAISTMTFSGPVTLTGRNILAVPANVTVNLTGKVTGTGSLTLTAATGNGSGGGTLSLSNAANDYSGGTVLANSGIFTSTLLLGGNTVLGSGPLFLGGGNLQGSVPVTISNPMSLASSTIAFTGSNNITLAGPIDARGLSTLTSSSATPSVTITGVIGGSGGIAKGGGNTLTLTANNTYKGSTSVSGGTLIIRGVQSGSAVAVTAGTLGGAGTIGFLAAEAAGVVNPGSAASPFNRFIAPGANFSTGGTLHLDIGDDAASGTDYDFLNLGTGRLILGAVSPLDFDLTRVTALRTAPGIVRYGSRLGTASQFAPVDVVNDSNGFNADVSYTATQLDLAVVDNVAPVVSLSGTISYVRGAPPVILAPSATVTDSDSSNFDSGELRVRIVLAGGANNTLGIGGSFTVDASNNVILNGTTIGVRTSNGVGTNELRITFNASATKAIVQQLVRAINYQNISGSAGQRKIEFTVSDGDGGTSDVRTKTVNVS